MMRDTVFALIGESDEQTHAAIRASVDAMVAKVQEYVPGYRLKQQVQFTPIALDEPVHTLLPKGAPAVTTKVSVFLEVEGMAMYLPAYAGNLDIMTSAAMRVAESIAVKIERTGSRADAGVTA